MTFKFSEGDFNISNYKKIEKELQDLHVEYKINCESLEKEKEKIQTLE
jgi:hypothetical protein